MTQTQNVDSVTDVLSVSKFHNFEFNNDLKLNAKQRQEKSPDISLASWLLRWVKNIIKPNDLWQHTDRVANRIAYSEAVKFF